MKNKYIIFATIGLAVISINNSMNALTFNTKNESGKELIVQIELLRDKTPYFRIVGNNQSAAFDFNNTTCFNNLKCVVYDQNLKNELANNKIDVSKIATDADNSAKLVKFLESNEKYRKTVAVKEKASNDFCKNCDFVIKSQGDGFTATYNTFYSYTFTNSTNSKVEVGVHAWDSIDNNTKVIIAPGETKTINFEPCVGQISYRYYPTGSSGSLGTGKACKNITCIIKQGGTTPYIDPL